ncbi:ETX/MTX2 family pore-forming toxin [Bacillus thuringiensis]
MTIHDINLDMQKLVSEELSKRFGLGQVTILSSSTENFETSIVDSTAVVNPNESKGFEVQNLSYITGASVQIRNEGSSPQTYKRTLSIKKTTVTSTTTVEGFSDSNKKGTNKSLKVSADLFWTLKGEANYGRNSEITGTLNESTTEAITATTEETITEELSIIVPAKTEMKVRLLLERGTVTVPMISYMAIPNKAKYIVKYKVKPDPQERIFSTTYFLLGWGAEAHKLPYAPFISGSNLVIPVTSELVTQPFVNTFIEIKEKSLSLFENCDPSISKLYQLTENKELLELLDNEGNSIFINEFGEFSGIPTIYNPVLWGN